MASQLDEYQYEELEEIINCVTDNLSKITSWEKQFIEDIQKRFEQHEKNTWISEKQWAVLRKLYDKCQNG